MENDLQATLSQMRKEFIDIRHFLKTVDRLLPDGVEK
jgi:hypothetical protein